MTSPQLLITLTPDRLGLQAELPGTNGSRRVVSLSSKAFFSDCLRMLLAQANLKVEIGLDGAPTQAQVKHWEGHSAQAPSDRCPFCLEAGWVHSRAGREKPREHSVGDGSVKVRRLPAKGKARGGGGGGGQKRILARKISASLEELGL